MERLNETEQNFFYCHSAPCFKLETIHDEPNIILSCSEDGTVRQYDLRTSVKCTKQPCYDVNQMILILLLYIYYIYIYCYTNIFFYPNQIEYIS